MSSTKGDGAVEQENYKNDDDDSNHENDDDCINDYIILELPVFSNRSVFSRYIFLYLRFAPFPD